MELINVRDEYRKNDEAIQHLCVQVCKSEERFEPCYIETRRIMLLLERQEHLMRILGHEQPGMARSVSDG